MARPTCTNFVASSVFDSMVLASRFSHSPRTDPPADLSVVFAEGLGPVWSQRASVYAGAPRPDQPHANCPLKVTTYTFRPVSPRFPSAGRRKVTGGIGGIGRAGRSAAAPAARAKGRGPQPPGASLTIFFPPLAFFWEIVFFHRVVVGCHDGSRTHEDAPGWTIRSRVHYRSDE